MQNQPKTDYHIYYEAIELPDEFPLQGLGNVKHSPSEKPISFLHFHDCLEIGYCHQGAGLFFVEERVAPFSQGDVSIIFKNELHIAQSDGENPSWWNFISLDPERLLADLSGEELAKIASITDRRNGVPIILSKEKYPDLVRRVYEIINELEGCNREYHSVIKALVWTFLLQLSRAQQPMTEREAAKVKDQNRDLIRLAPALHYISHNYMNSISLEEMATLCHMSITHFRRLFQLCFNMPPSEYLYRARIKMASILLKNSDLSILQISLQVGYNSLSSFNRHFRRIMNSTPREWRSGERIKWEEDKKIENTLAIIGNQKYD